MERVRQRMLELGVDALLLSHGADLPWLTGYRAMPLERLTMLVLPVAGNPRLVVPALEAPRVAVADELFGIEPWSDGQDPIDSVVSALGGAGGGSSSGDLRLAVSDRAWAVSLMALQQRMPDARWIEASRVTSPIRAVKDASEVAALRTAGAAADRVAAALHSGDLPLIGRTEAEVSSHLSALLVEEGHQQVNFAIVGSGPNAASPHHQAGERVIGRDETVVCDFGGSYSLDGDVGYCSDITRTVVTGVPSPEIAACYRVLEEAQREAVASARAGVTAEHVDKVARDIIESAGFGELFMHRTGHGIGIEEHEDPYLVSGNSDTLRPGHAFSIEPGIYCSGRFGMRLEDIVVIGDDGQPEPLNSVEHGLVVVEA
jgi:Xaa-Pro aminopeptidase